MAKKILITNYQCPGDVCMLAYAMKALHESHPNDFEIGYQGSFSSIFKYSNYIKPIKKSQKDVQIIKPEYPSIHKSNQYPVRFVNSFVEDLENELDVKINPIEFAGWIDIGEEEKYWYSAVRQIIAADVPYWIINAGYKKDFTAKQWEFTRYQKIVEMFPNITFVQIGHKDHIHPELVGKNLINMVGKTDDRELIRLVYNSFGVISPVSLPFVLSYAIPPHPRFKRKSRACITIAGGREPNHWQQGPNQQFLHTCGMLDCCDLGGCWKSRVEPLGDGDSKDLEQNLCNYPTTTKSNQVIAKCMDMISVEDVAIHIKRYMDNLNYNEIKAKNDKIIISANANSNITEEEKIISENITFEKDKYGVIKQVSPIEPFVYNEDYITNQSTTVEMAYLRLGYVVSKVGYDTLVNSKCLELGPGNGKFFENAQKYVKSIDGYDVADTPYSTTSWKNIIDNKWDIVFAYDTIEHMPNIKEFFDINFDFAFVSVPRIPDNKDLFNSNWRHFKPNEHIYYFNEISFSKMANDYGFKVKDVSSIEDIIRTRWDVEQININTYFLQRM